MVETKKFSIVEPSPFPIRIFLRPRDLILPGVTPPGKVQENVLICTVGLWNVFHLRDADLRRFWLGNFTGGVREREV